jgi:hypothetical protein
MRTFAPSRPNWLHEATRGLKVLLTDKYLDFGAMLASEVSKV